MFALNTTYLYITLWFGLGIRIPREYLRALHAINTVMYIKRQKIVYFLHSNQLVNTYISFLFILPCVD